MRLKILVVDDVRVIANTLVKILENSGYEAIAVYAGDKAVTTAITFQPDAFICDVIMPGLSGIEAAIEVRKNLSNCKILLFSGQQLTADLLNEAKGQGYDFEIIAKPIPPAALLVRLKDLTESSDETGLAS